MHCNKVHNEEGGGVTLAYTVQLCPGNKDEVVESSPLLDKPGWSGIKVLGGEFPLRPAPSQLWQCPVMPFIIAGMPFIQLSVALRGDRLRQTGRIMEEDPPEEDGNCEAFPAG